MKKKELNQENVELRMQLDKYKRKIIGLEHTIENQRTHLARLQSLYDNSAQSNAHKNKVERLKGQIGKKDAEIKELNRQLEQYVMVELREALAEIERLKKNIACITRIEKTPEVKIYQKRIELEFKELESANIEIERLNGVIQEAETLLKVLDKIADDRDIEIKKLKEAISISSKYNGNDALIESENRNIELIDEIARLNGWIDALIEMGPRNSLRGNVFTGWSALVGSIKKWREDHKPEELPKGIRFVGSEQK